MKGNIILLSVQFFLIAASLSLTVFIHNESLLIEIFKVMIIVTYFWSIFCAKLKLSWFHPYIIFLGTFFLFNLSRIVLDLVGYWDLEIVDLALGGALGNNTLLKLLNVYLISLLCLNLGYLLYSNTSKTIVKFELRNNEAFEKIYTMIFFLVSLAR
ncbi:O-antigen polysaccharide polymerase Wzy [Bacillus sp. P14.5]|uniref:O-antigen polysaccharide polymerase Wzy n=1 Tax=Bacillus sp. P14.5 TaxID=1983400 RepID=UPI000DE8B927|nr:O-antigen polysaccharide polymerase Wzy [Bacillus sp. P14.5]